MNWAVLKDFRTMLGLTTAMLLGIISVVLAVRGNGYWGVLVVLASILTFLSIVRADKVYKSNC